jgi:hypothetical protein
VKKDIFLWLCRFISVLSLLFLVLRQENAQAANPKSSAKTISCNSAKNIVRVSTKRITALSFLENPKEIVPGDSSFDFKRVQNDVFIKALSMQSRTNVFVFVGQKRCRFELVASEIGVDDLLEVREAPENVMEVHFNDK